MIAPAILDQFGRPYAASRLPRQQPAPANGRGSRGRSLQARYDVAQTTDTNAAYWAMADALDADAANSLTVRKRIRERARYEVANNPYLAGIVDRQAVFEIATGPDLQVHGDDEDFNTEVEEAWGRWADAVDLAGLLRTMVMARVVDGEAFAILGTNPATDDEVKLNFLAVECDRVTSPQWYGQLENYVDGITFDDYGNPLSYDVLTYHPGASVQGVTRDAIEIPADRMLHLFRPKRPGQHRGVTEIASSLTIMPGLRRFVAATIFAAETAAKLAGIVETPLAAGDLPDSTEPGTVDIPFGALAPLPYGSKLSQLKAEHPNTLHSEFLKSGYGQVGSPLSMPRNISMSDSSDMNFASAQIDALPYWSVIAVLQKHTQRYVLRRIMKAWYAEAAYAYQWTANRRILQPYTFNWVGKPYSNPVDDATATQTNLASGATTFPAVYAVRGKDCLTEWTKQAAALGLTLDEYRKLVIASVYGPAPQSPQRMVDAAAAIPAAKVQTPETPTDPLPTAPEGHADVEP